MSVYCIDDEQKQALDRLRKVVKDYTKPEYRHVNDVRILLKMYDALREGL